MPNLKLTATLADTPIPWTFESVIERCAVECDKESETARAYNRSDIHVKYAAKHIRDLKPGAPPLVNGRPSCCEDAIETEVLWSQGSSWVVGFLPQKGDGCFRDCHFCPFCGAKLPEVPR